MIFYFKHKHKQKQCPLFFLPREVEVGITFFFYEAEKSVLAAEEDHNRAAKVVYDGICLSFRLNKTTHIYDKLFL